MAKGKKINKKEFEKIKLLTSYKNLSSRDIQKISEKGYSTVMRIKASETYTDYRKLVTDYHKVMLEKRKAEMLKTEPKIEVEIVEMKSNGGSGGNGTPAKEIKTVSNQDLIEATKENTKAIIALQNTILSVSKANKSGWGIFK